MLFIFQIEYKLYPPCFMFSQGQKVSPIMVKLKNYFCRCSHQGYYPAMTHLCAAHVTISRFCILMLGEIIQKIGKYELYNSHCAGYEFNCGFLLYTECEDNTRVRGTLRTTSITVSYSMALRGNWRKLSGSEACLVY